MLTLTSSTVHGSVCGEQDNEMSAALDAPRDSNDGVRTFVGVTAVRFADARASARVDAAARIRCRLSGCRRLSLPSFVAGALRAFAVVIAKIGRRARVVVVAWLAGRHERRRALASRAVADRTRTVNERAIRSRHCFFHFKRTEKKKKREDKMMDRHVVTTVALPHGVPFGCFLSMQTDRCRRTRQEKKTIRGDRFALLFRRPNRLTRRHTRPTSAQRDDARTHTASVVSESTLVRARVGLTSHGALDAAMRHTELATTN